MTNFGTIRKIEERSAFTLYIPHRCSESSFGSTDQQSFCNVSNINNRHLDMSAVLDDLGLKQYKNLFEIEEVSTLVILFFSLRNLFIPEFSLQIDLMAFLLLTDSDLQEIGVKDGYHREIFTGTIEKLNYSIIN